MSVDEDINEEYVAAWNDLKRRWRLFLFFFLSFVPLGGGIGIALSSLFHSDIPFTVVGGAWFLAAPISNIYLYTFRCPRCKKPFLLKIGASFHDPFKPRCAHCGIPSGTLRDPGNMEEDIAAINAQSRRNLKRALLIFDSGSTW